MGKEKRKTRLDKVSVSGGTDFIGFSAFADVTPPPGSRNSGRQLDHQSSAVSSTPALTAWTPVYEGKDERFGALFARIRDKRDSVTVGRGLKDLHELISDTTIQKPLQAEALQHWAWLYHSKLYYDNNATVRAASMQTWLIAWKRIPKVVYNLVLVQPEVLGMLYSVQVDPSAEVRAVPTSATDFFPHKQERIVDDDPVTSTSSWPWQQGILTYVSRILSYDRSSVMHDELFARKKDASLELNDRSRDMLEERYERIVSTAISALESWILTFYDSRGSMQVDGIEVVDSSKWWKNLSSPKTTLRRKTYSLLGAASSKAPNLMPYEDILIKKLAQALSSEKEASNLPTLLETILTVVARCRQTKNESNQQTTPSLWSLLVKPLSKILKKSCYGAKVDQWGPIMLPLTVQLSEIVECSPSKTETPLPENAVTIVLIKAMNDGRELVFGDIDKNNLLSAISECTTFQLLRKRSASSAVIKETALILAELWLDSFKYILTLPCKSRGLASSNQVGMSRMNLLKQIGNELLQFQDATKSRPECAFYAVAEWFWHHGLDFSDGEIDNLAQLVQFFQISPQQIASSAPEPDCDSHKTSLLVPPLRRKVNNLVNQYQTSSNIVPDDSAYQLLLAAFECFGPLAMFESSESDAQGSLKRFVINDLLRWIVIHTSILSTQQQTSSLVEQDFRLLSCCLKAVADERESLWESLLREIIAAKCNLEWIVTGIQQILRLQNQNSMDWLRCDTFDNYAISIGTHSTSHFQSVDLLVDQADTDSVEGDSAVAHLYEKELNFYKLCLGFDSDPGPNDIMISTNVLSKWIEMNCISSQAATRHVTVGAQEHDPVLEALLLVIKNKRFLLNESQVDLVLLEAWYRSSNLHEVYSLPSLQRENVLLDRFLSQASLQLKEDVKKFSCEKVDSEFLLLGNAWAMRAWRLLSVCTEWGGRERSLALVGLGDSSTWERNPEISFRLCMALFERTDSKTSRLSLVQGFQPSVTLLFEILLSLSEASTDVLLSARTRMRKDRCWMFLEALGGMSVEKSFLESVVRSSIISLENRLKQQDDGSVEKHVCRGVAVLSQVLDLLLTRIDPSALKSLSVEDVTEGSQLWYITTPENPEDRQLVQVVKVHNDDQAGYFFTIQLDCGGQVQERQTILGRLRRDAGCDCIAEGVPLQSISKEELSLRTNIRDLIVDKLLKPFCFPKSRLQSLGEVITVIVHQIGLGSDRGIGRSHYEIYRLLRPIEEQFRLALGAGDMNVASNALWVLAVALGFGLNCPSSPSTINEIRLNALQSCADTVNHYSGDKTIANIEFDKAVLAWLIVSIPSLANDSAEENEVILSSIALLFRLSCNVFSSENTDDFTGSIMLACRAVFTGIAIRTSRTNYLSKSSDSLISDLDNAKSDALFYLIRSFSLGWNCSSICVEYLSSNEVQPAWISFSEFPSLVKLSREKEEVRRSIALASARNCEGLSEALQVKPKQYFAFLLLDAVASLGNPLQKTENEVKLSKETTSRLRRWIESCDGDEAEEIMTDIYIVAEWTPLNMMKEVESWIENDPVEVDEATAAGRLLTWIAYLRFVDSAAPKDYTIRPAFVSYLGKCGAISSILTLTLVNNEAIYERKREAIAPQIEMAAIFPNESLVSIQRLASLALFRTIEVFPSLSRRWWEEDCVKVYTSLVQAYVEKYVAPEILKRELERIKSVTTFGPMKVTASLVSREVTASYVQDDFTLTVMITLPAAFPFRSAEVDCSKTLGVPQSRWKRWSLQITMMLNNQGGTLHDALMLWKDNVDKEFEGVEPCPVCYSVLHVKTHKLPTLECKTCHKRFHVDCLTQWFRSSGKNQCVLCQQPWSGTRVQ